MRVGLPIAALALAVAFGAGFSAAHLTSGGQKVLGTTRAPAAIVVGITTAIDARHNLDRHPTYALAGLLADE